MMLASLSIRELRERLARREVSALEVARAHLDRIDALDGETVRSLLTVTRQRAEDQAKQADRRLQAGDSAPLLGVPVILEDVLTTRGIRTTAGSKILEQFVPIEDATITRRLAEAGTVLLGKSNMDEFAMGSSTENSGYFPTRNPWDLERVPGGSSGGSAAAVAAEFAPFALGTDTGGSIRQPGALCGVVGFKPTYGRVSRYGLIAFASSLDQIGPLSRTVEDAADVNDLRIALGYKQIDLYGISYGTRLAETVMRLYPEGIRSVVLDSVVPLPESLYTAIPAAMAHAFRVLFEGCARDATCDANYPNLRSAFDQAVKRLDAKPVHIKALDARTNESFKVAINGSLFASLVFGAQYDSSLIAGLPQLIWRVAHGKYGLLARMAGYLTFPQTGESDGMQRSVFCGEDAPYATVDAIAVSVKMLPARLQSDSLTSTRDGLDACKVWNVSAVPDAQKQPLRSAIPTLILDGEYDPVTPPSNGAEAQATLSNSFRFVYPGVGHGVRYSAPCANSMVNAFFDHPEQKPDDACISSMSEPAFQAPSAMSLRDLSATSGSRLLPAS